MIIYIIYFTNINIFTSDFIILYKYKVLKYTERSATIFIKIYSFNSKSLSFLNF